MSATVTNRVFLPDGQKVYVSDNQYGDQRLEELYSKFGNLRVETCEKILGTSLDDCASFWSGTIEEFFS